MKTKKPKHRELIHSNTQAANILGLSQTFFNTCNKTLYNFCMFHGKSDLVKGYNLYNKYLDIVKLKFNAIYYSYECTYKFAQALEPMNLYTSINGACVSLEQIYKGVI